METFNEELPLRLIVGGLRTEQVQPMSPNLKASLRHHWEVVQATTGQPFDWTFFERDDFVYDTEHACRAAVAVRCLAPALTLPFFARMQQAFYAENRDITSETELVQIASEFDIPAETFVTVLNAGEIAEATRDDFRLSQTLGITGFPTVFLQHASTLDMLTSGYQPFEALRPVIEAWLASRD